jgi:RNA polymerase sigma factor (sigma-70 family)
MLRPLRRPHSASHEDAFADRYARLLAWAKRLTEGDRLAAEDLVHDAFVNFTLSRPKLDAIQNLDGYLFTSLRHLHLANVRRGRRRADSQLPLIEYDSALDALGAQWAGRAHEELTTICHYACLRRQSSKAASVLILRFFHGYALAEIARVLRLAPRAVDTLLSVARREVRAWMDNPRPLRSVGRPDASVPRILGIAQPDAFVAEVQRAIFDSVYGVCRSSSEIERLYEPSAPSLDSDALAHVVSCRPCLDRINTLLGLPRLAERHPDDGIGGGRRPPRGPGGGGAATGSGEEICAEVGGRRARDVSSRRPSELRIAVNGIVVGGQQVRDSGVSQHVTVQTVERLGFVEVLDERDARLLLLSVDAAPDGAIDQSAHVELSDHRELDVTVSFASTWPIVTVTYRIPEVAPTHATTETADSSSDPILDFTTRSNETRPSWWRRASHTFVPWPRPVLVALALLLVLALSIGPQDAVAAVMRAGRALLNVLTTLVSGVDNPDERRDVIVVPRRNTDVELLAHPKAVTPAPARAPRTPPGLSERARLGLKVEILDRLDRIDALFGEGLALSDGSNGNLKLEGVVQDLERQREILGALGALRHIPHLEVKLLSASTAVRAAPRPTSVHGVDVMADRVPIHELLTRRLESRGVAPGPALDEAVRSSSARVLDLSRRAVLHTWAFKRLATQVSEASLSASDGAARRTWYGLLQKHANAFEESSRHLRAELNHSGLMTTVEAVPSPASHIASAALAADALMRAGEHQDRTIRSLFVAVSDAPASDPEASLLELTHQLNVSRNVAQSLVQYCITQSQ